MLKTVSKVGVAETLQPACTPLLLKIEQVEGLAETLEELPVVRKLDLRRNPITIKVGMSAVHIGESAYESSSCFRKQV